MLFRQSEAADSAQWTGLVPQGPYRHDDALPGTPRRRSRALTAPPHPQPAWHLGRWRLTSCSSSYKASLRTPNAFSLAKAYETGDLKQAPCSSPLPPTLPQGLWGKKPHLFVSLQVCQHLQKVVPEAGLLGHAAKTEQSWLCQVHHQPGEITKGGRCCYVSLPGTNTKGWPLVNLKKLRNQQ